MTLIFKTDMRVLEQHIYFRGRDYLYRMFFLLRTTWKEHGDKGYILNQLCLEILLEDHIPTYTNSHILHRTQACLCSFSMYITLR